MSPVGHNNDLAITMTSNESNCPILHHEKPSPLKRSYLEIILSKLVLISTNWNYLQFGRSPSLIFTLEIIYANLVHNYLPLFQNNLCSLARIFPYYLCIIPGYHEKHMY